jgi:hypothetical protein
MQFSSAAEFRRDDAEQLDRTHTERNVWLFRNNLTFRKVHKPLKRKGQKGFLERTLRKEEASEILYATTRTLLRN